MYEKELLRKLINYEFDKIRQCGDKIRIKSVTRKRTFSTVFALLLIVLYLLGSSTVEDIVFGLSFILAIWAAVFFSSTNEKRIAKLAMKNPDTPVSEIIKGKMI